MSYFLLLYDRRQGHLLRPPVVFSDSEADRALTARFELEDEYRSKPDVEVVLLGSESIDDLKRTHARYFKSLREIATAG
jgi:hypothetical protein